MCKLAMFVPGSESGIDWELFLITHGSYERHRGSLSAQLVTVLTGDTRLLLAPPVKLWIVYHDLATNREFIQQHTRGAEPVLVMKHNGLTKAVHGFLSERDEWDVNRTRWRLGLTMISLMTHMLLESAKYAPDMENK